MKKVLATILALVSLLSSLAVVTNANEDNSNNGALIVYDPNPSMLTRLNNLVTFDPSSKVNSCLDSCSKSFKDCLKAPIFVSYESLENQYNNCLDDFNSCLKNNCLKVYKKDKDKLVRIIGDSAILAFNKILNDLKVGSNVLFNEALNLAGCSKDAIVCAFTTPSVKCFSDFKDCVIK